jgi:NAD(P)-dependent dehydrogenase (short-subunit alcohol dehydrogenase family)
MPAIDGRTRDVMHVALLGSANPLGRALSLGLEDLGARVHGLPDADAYDSGAALEAALGEIGLEPIPLDAVVDASAPGEATSTGALAELTADEWRRRAEDPLRRALYVLQGAFGFLSRHGGSVVVVLPSLAMTGAARVAPWTAAAEGYRALVKANARAWGPKGVNANCVCLPTVLIAGVHLERAGLPPPALGRLPDVRTEVAPVVGALAGGAFRWVTGQTLALDGGVLMAP